MNRSPKSRFMSARYKTDAHSVLMALAVVGAGREKAALIEVDIKIELAFARRELRGELGFRRLR